MSEIRKLPAGLRLGSLSDLATVPAVTHVVRAGDGSIAVIIARTATGCVAYVNECPHMGLRLDDMRDRIVSTDGTRLICSAHNAQFSLATGQAMRGLPADCALTAIPVATTETGDIVTI